jgi:hypothetical protein
VLKPGGVAVKHIGLWTRRREFESLPGYINPSQVATFRLSGSDTGTNYFWYNQQLLKRTLAEVEEAKLMLRTIFAGLKGSFNFEKSLIEHVACEDEVDREILQVLFEAGSPNLLPKDVATRLSIDTFLFGGKSISAQSLFPL